MVTRRGFAFHSFSFNLFPLIVVLVLAERTGHHRRLHHPFMPNTIKLNLKLCRDEEEFSDLSKHRSGKGAQYILLQPGHA